MTLRKRKSDERIDGHPYRREMTLLAWSLPMLQWKMSDPANGLDPWNPERLLERMGPWSHGEKLAARFLLNFWSGNFNTRDKRYRFSLVEAMGVWDDGNMRAFLDVLEDWTNGKNGPYRRWWP